ncbi:MAG TPA: hypothetical protein RMH99_13785 [Sandaracinaceae bacterium LLY-WYZ-13_1]|nr:hypothetical protein [Sandaracinaceae bacterium LLY-WYZ-13_1]
MAPAERCAADAPVALGAVDGRRPPTVAIAMGSAGGLAAREAADDRLEVQALSEVGAPRGDPVEVAFRGAPGLAVRVAVERGFLAITRRRG